MVLVLVEGWVQLRGEGGTVHRGICITRGSDGLGSEDAGEW